MTASPDRPRVFYVSYDGVQEPLGRSQVLAYLTRLADEFDITLISFEKSRRPRPEPTAQPLDTRITWAPLRYHRRPPVLSTALDVLAGRRALVRAARGGAPAVVHVRSYVPALMAVLARRATGGRLLFDIRGFWADERVEGGLWPAGGLLYRIAKRCERRFFAEADAIVTLTHASVPQVRAWSAGSPASIEVIPTCVDLRRFRPRPPRPDGPRAVWNGSIGTWYRFDLAPRVARALSLPLEVITRQTLLAGQTLDGYPACVRSVPPDEVPHQLFSGDIGLCLIASSFSKVASAPTRFAEYLAAGMPVLVTPGVGDLESLVERNGVGVVLRGEDDCSIHEAATRMRALAGDPKVQERCRALAQDRFDVDVGAERYAEIYRSLVGGGP